MFAGLSLLVPAVAPQEVQWDRDVRPILSQHCFQCHGPDEATREARLRLDVAGVREDERGIVVPGDPAASELVRRVTSADPDERMPPPELGKDLTAEQVEVLRAWVEQGAPYQDHWSFRSVGDPAPPAVAERHGTVTSIDAFVLARLADAGFEPAPEADRPTLIRRVTFDLTGAPPTREEVTEFLADERPDAYEHLVDRLLASDAFAERMTLAWMDAARYGDTSVYHADGPRDMWPWRDWVLSAYDQNLPFDEFTTWQLAGDLLPEATIEQRVASGFHRNNGTSDEGGAIDEELRVSYVVDRVKTTGNVWLGLSLECSQCHDHKYDPVEQEDYYRFYAFFNQANEKGFQTRNGNAPPLMKVPTMDQRAEQVALVERVSEAETAFAAAAPPVEELAAWSVLQRAELLTLDLPELGTWSALGPFKAGSSKEAFNKAFGPENELNPLNYTTSELTWTLRPEWPEGKPQTLGSSPNSAYYLHRTLTTSKATRQALSLGSDDTISVWLNGEQVLHKEVYRGTQPDQERVELDLAEGENHLLLKIVNGGGPSGFYFKQLGSALPDAIIASLRLAESSRDAGQRNAVLAHFKRDVWEEGRALAAELDGARQRQQQLEGQISSSMVLGDVSGGRQTYVLSRGMYDAPLKDRPVDPGVLDFLLSMPEGAPSNRLGLARWLTHPDHPLTARVAVNRYWAMLFGRGLVTTVMDFGSQGAYPSHPALLDWLAHDFVEGGWDVKRTLRQIVASRTYRQSSRRRPELEALDPENELLGRGARFRLQGEFIRDQALAVSGLLVDRVGGPGVKPYQPAGLWNEVSLNNGLRFARDSGEKLYRKSMYIYWKRSAPMPVMTIFDAPTREKCVVQRQRTNTPLQALVVMNDEQFVEAARHLAERMLAAGAGFEERLDEGFLRCTARPADQTRRAVLRRVHDETLAEFRAEPERAAALLAVGASKRDEALDPAEHATWTVMASLILNLDETLTRD
jgi:mono/diheme cytochrome c family protein